MNATQQREPSAGRAGSSPQEAGATPAARSKDAELEADFIANGRPKNPLDGRFREWAKFVFRSYHYARSVPSGKTHYLFYDGVFFAFSIPANKNISNFLIGEANSVWELSRMWANDKHSDNALTAALKKAVKEFHSLEPEAFALVSYADPNVGHHGGVYKAASWVATGQSEEARYYKNARTGQVVSRRKFHSNGTHLNKPEILALGYEEMKLPGKIRFAKGLTEIARKKLRRFNTQQREG